MARASKQKALRRQMRAQSAQRNASSVKVDYDQDGQGEESTNLCVSLDMAGGQEEGQCSSPLPVFPLV